jgi:uncharacterized secreted protein with C-terminal beta-propeller domain
LLIYFYLIAVIFTVSLDEENSIKEKANMVVMVEKKPFPNIKNKSRQHPLLSFSDIRDPFTLVC